MFNFAKISPSIIAVDYNNEETLQKALNDLKKAGVTMLHLDVMDGLFVKNKTFDYNFVKKIQGQTDFLLDVHLMVQNPIEQIEFYAEAGADIISVHYEACDDLLQTVKEIKDYNCLSGVAISPSTDPTCLTDVLKSGLVDIVLVMSVEPGACGQNFIAGSAEKIIKIKELNKNVEVEIDGGITAENSALVRKCGADIIVSGSTVFKAQDMSEMVNLLQGTNYKSKFKGVFKIKK